MIDIRNAIIAKQIPENENPNKIVDIVVTTLDFNKQPKDKEIKILTSKQMLQRLPVELAQLKAGNTSTSTDKSYIFCAEKKKLLKEYTAI